MSIIEEALRRLQDPLLHPAQKPQAEAPVAPPPAPPPVKPVEPKPIHSWPTAIAPTPTPTPLPYSPTLLAAAVAAIILSSLAVLAGGAWWLGHLSRAPSAPASTIPAPTLAAMTAIPRAPQPSPTDEEPTDQAQSERPMSAMSHPPVPATIHPIANLSDEFVISGLVVGGGEPYAVINGAIVAVGDQIGDFTLVEITNGAARLRRTDGSEVALRVPR